MLGCSFILEHVKSALIRVPDSVKTCSRSFLMLTEAMTDKPFSPPTPNLTPVHQLFEQQVQRTPERIAVIHEAEHLTYRQLNAAANRLAHYLLETQHIQTETLVGIMLDNSAAMLVAMLGVLKAGGAYVPINPDFPEERLRSMVNDAQLRLILADKHHLKTLNRLQWDCPSLQTYLCLDCEDPQAEPETTAESLMEPELWDYTASTAANPIAAAGWLNSYTGAPFTEAEIAEYCDNTLRKLRPYLTPQTRVLEIGCGAGHTLQTIAPHVACYCALDLSAVLIEKCRAVVAEKAWPHVQLHVLAGHELPQLTATDFDLIIINSVTQFMDGHNYLRQLLRLVIPRLKSSGIIFIGDVWDLDQKDELRATLQAFKAYAAPAMKTKTDLTAELFLSRQYFLDLQADLPGVNRVVFSSKTGLLDNELNRFHYDVLLQVEREISVGSRKLQLASASDDAQTEVCYSLRHKYQLGLAALGNQPTDTVNALVTPAHLAYLIYTSGSTGRPKGVMIEHRALTNYVTWAVRAYIRDETDLRFPLFTSFSFDLTVTSIFVPLVSGNIIVVYDSDAREVAIERIVAENQVNVIKLTPSHLKLIAHHLRADSRLKRFIVGGEALETETARQIHRTLQDRVEIFNEYGPTEATVGCMIYRYDPQRDTSSAVPIGAPIDHMEICILNEALQPVAIGEEGELYIAGIGLARGYLHNPELSKAKFVPNPQRPGERMYKTGDVARRLSPKVADFIGRRDEQVKIRGFRIELSEIEAILRHDSRILDAVVLLEEAENRDRRLVAYLLMRPQNEKLLVEEMRAFLQQKLPPYMIPSIFKRVNDIPLTLNGKVDRKALKALGVILEVGEHYTPPVTVLEQQLATLWQAVLKITRVGTDDDFFMLGGHSLLAMTLAARILRELGVNVSVADIFKNPTVQELADFLQKTTAPAAVPGSIPPTLPKAHYVLSSAQQRMFLLHQFHPSGIHYNLTAWLDMTEPIDPQCLQEALRRLIQRHDILRTAFIWADNQPAQIIRPEVDFRLEIIESGNSKLKLASHEQVKPVLDQQAEACYSDFARPFDLNQPPLFRACYIKLSDDRHRLIIDTHHIVFDGASWEILISELIRLYHAAALGNSSPSTSSGQSLEKGADGLSDDEAPRLQYKDYAEWQRQQLDTPALQVSADFWRRHLSGELPVLDMPADFPRPATPDYAGDWVTVAIDPMLAAKVRQLAKDQKTTLFMTLFAAYAAFLYKYTGQEEFIIGTFSAGRHSEELNDVIGMFVNTLPVRCHVSGAMTFVELLAEVKAVWQDIQPHAAYPFDLMPELIRYKRDPARNPLFDTAIVLQQDPAVKKSNNLAHTFEHASAKNLGFDCQWREVKNPATLFDFHLEAVVTETGLTFNWQFSASLFKQETVVRFQNHWVQLLTAVVTQPGQPLRAADMLTAAEKETIRLWNATQADFPAEQTVTDFFEIMVARQPTAPAVHFQRRTLTYGQLNSQANRLAGQLKQRGVDQDTIVGVIMERSLELIIALLAIHKAGGAYLPISPGDPPARQAFMLSDSGAVLLLINTDTPSALEWDGPVLNLQNWSSELQFASPNWSSKLQFASHNAGKRLQTEVCYSAEFAPEFVSQARPTGLAYVIYTSGSTGQPKGVMIEHRALMNRLYWMQRRYPLTPQDVILQKTPYTFDVSVWEFFWWSMFGAQMVLAAPGAERDPAALCQTIEAFGVTTLHFVPPMLSAFLREVSEKQAGQRLRTLRRVFASGDALSISQVNEFNRLFTQNSGDVPGTSTICTVDKTDAAKCRGHFAQLINLYGPTEAAIDVSYFDCPADPVEIVPIGKPIDNIRLYVINKDAQWQSVGVPGEIVIAGVGLARGYLNRPDLTREKFVPNPFASENSPLEERDKRMYRTGDLGRWLPAGNIEFLSRLDHQVKVRGFRIELGEIEAALRESGNFAEVLVMAESDGGGDRQIVAYGVLKTVHPAMSPAELRAQLAKRLPPYMVPARFVFTDKFPVTANGKIDRRALSELGRRQAEAIVSPLPATPTEQAVADLYCRALGVAHIGAQDDFFDLGGDSLKLLNLASLLRTNKGVDVPLSLLFKHTRVAELAAYLDQADEITSSERYLVFNENQQHLLFGFPPAFGHGLVYQMLAAALPAHTLYAFHFEPSAAPIADYGRMITALQPHGPYDLLGYSGGGNLAFETAKWLETHGHPVSKIILLDAFRKKQKLSALTVELRGIRDDMIAGIAQRYGAFGRSIEEMTRTIRAYYDFVNLELADETGLVAADVHAIHAEGRSWIQRTAMTADGREILTDWTGASLNMYRVYHGYGAHETMLEGDFVAQNAAIIRTILGYDAHQL